MRLFALDESEAAKRQMFGWSPVHRSCLLAREPLCASSGRFFRRFFCLFRATMCRAFCSYGKLGESTMYGASCPRPAYPSTRHPGQRAFTRLLRLTVFLAPAKRARTNAASSSFRTRAKQRVGSRPLCCPPFRLSRVECRSTMHFGEGVFL
ncbi:hypothetical protein TRVL_09379 [Trypanosoma vivax]|nr:hypothetical protein TRVL_09379 [Trypanosoma vivax]